MILRDIPLRIERLVAEYNSEEWDGAPVTDERRTEIEHELDGLDISMEEKADSIADIIGHYESESELISNEVKRLNALKKQRDNHSKWLENWLSINLQRANKTKFETTLHKFSFRESQSLVVNNADSIPEQYLRIIPATSEPDKNAIKEAIKRGEAISGCFIDVKQNLQIK